MTWCGREPLPLSCPAASCCIAQYQAWELLRQKGISVQVLNVCCPLHIPAQVLKDAAAKGIIITYEDHNVKTGLGSIVANGLMENRLSCRLRKLGITSYSSSGPPEELFKASGLSASDLVKAVEEEMAKTVNFKVNVK